jgi:hypothetical protein
LCAVWLQGLTLPSSLQTLPFGWMFNKTLESSMLPYNLQGVPPEMECFTLQNNLQTFPYGDEADHNQSL